MALTPLSGSSTTPSVPDDTPGASPVRASDAMAHMPFITDSALNKFAIDTSQYANVTRQLVGFAKGKRVVVDYYRLLRREGINNRTNVADLPNARHVNHTEYQKIVGLEITLQKEFEYTPDPEQGNAKITGSAMLYPNMNPSVGDMFLMGVGDGRVGIGRVSSVQAMTWRTDRVYLINFIIPEFAERVVTDPLEGSVSIVSYFNKENYLGGTAALLSEQSYVQLNKIREQRVILSRMYHQMFFNRSRNSYFNTNGEYDPWVVLFMCTKLRMEDVQSRPKNLIGRAEEDYQKTIWARLEDSRNNTMYLLDPCYQKRGYDQTTMGSFVSELHDRATLYPMGRAEGASDYIFSEAFYAGRKTEMTAFELLIFEAITLKTSGPLTTLITEHLDTVFTLPPSEQFYKIPLCIHLIDMALRSQYREIDAQSMNYATSEDET